MAGPTTLEILSAWIGLDRQLVELALLQTENYKRIEIPKRNGDKRIIHIPSEALALVQKSLLECLYCWNVHSYMHGFVIGRSPVSNASIHLRLSKKDKKLLGPDEKFLFMAVPRHVLKLDLSNAFHAVTSEAVNRVIRTAFRYPETAGLKPEKGDADIKKKRWDIIEHIGRNGYFVDPLADLITKLTTTEGLLPQGASTSPYLLNMAICESGMMDRLQKACEPRRARFTVYADDITISTKAPEIGPGFIAAIIEAIETSGQFSVNHKKTLLTDSRHRAPVITGVTLGTNSDGTGRLSIEQSHLREIRRILWCASKLLEKGTVPTAKKHGFSLDQALGHAAWVDNVFSGQEPHSLITKPLLRFREAFRRLTQKSGEQIFMPFIKVPSSGRDRPVDLRTKLLLELLDAPIEERIRRVDTFNTQHNKR